MLRIMEKKENDNSTTLRLYGRIASQWVGLLRSNCDRIIQSNSRLTLDIGGVSFADHDGVELLRQLQERQVILVNSSPFLQEQLKLPVNSRSASE